MAAKGAPQAAAAPNSTQLRKAPVSLRSAMRRYAEGGDVTTDAPDYSRAYGALGGAEAVNDMRNQFKQMGLDENTIGSVFSKYYAPETSQPAPVMETRRPPERPTETGYGDPGIVPYAPPIAPKPNPYDVSDPYPFNPKGVPYVDATPTEPRRPERPVMPEIYPQDYAGPRTTGSTQTQQIGPRTSYRQEADGTLTEIGYNGDPISGYTPEQLAMHNATTGVTSSGPRQGGVTLDDGTFIPGVGNDQGGVNIGTPDFFQKYANDPITMDRLRQLYGFTGNQPEYREPQIGYNPEPQYPDPQTRYYEPEVPMPYEQPIPTTSYEPPVNYNPKPNQTSQGLSRLIKDALASGTGSLEEQRKLMALLQSIGIKQ